MELTPPPLFLNSSLSLYTLTHAHRYLVSFQLSSTFHLGLYSVLIKFRAPNTLTSFDFEHVKFSKFLVVY